MFLLGFLSELLNSFFSVMGVFLVLRECSLFLISFLAGRRRDVPRTCGERCHDEVSPYVPSSYIFSGFFIPLHDLSPWAFCLDQDYFLLRVSSIYNVLYTCTGTVSFVSELMLLTVRSAWVSISVK